MVHFAKILDLKKVGVDVLENHYKEILNLKKISKGCKEFYEVYSLSILNGLRISYETNDSKSFKFFSNIYYQENENIFFDEIKDQFIFYLDSANKVGFAQNDDNDSIKNNDEKKDLELFIQSAETKYGVSKIKPMHNGYNIIVGYGDGADNIMGFLNKEIVRLFNARHEFPIF